MFDFASVAGRGRFTVSDVIATVAVSVVMSSPISRGGGLIK